MSIIRDRGIDANALRFILDHHEQNRVYFLDGWTGKGVIARELQTSVMAFNAAHSTQLPTELLAVSDLCGDAAHSATSEDYLIPSAILGGVISGLVSRSILNEQIGEDDFHGCVLLDDLSPFDRSRWFVEQIETASAPLTPNATQLEDSAPPTSGHAAVSTSLTSWCSTALGTKTSSNPASVRRLAYAAAAHPCAGHSEVTLSTLTPPTCAFWQRKKAFP